MCVGSQILRGPVSYANNTLRWLRSQISISMNFIRRHRTWINLSELGLCLTRQCTVHMIVVRILVVGDIHPRIRIVRNHLVVPRITIEVRHLTPIFGCMLMVNRFVSFLRLMIILTFGIIILLTFIRTLEWWFSIVLFNWKLTLCFPQESCTASWSFDYLTLPCL